jgi:hypothetical protein
MTTTVPAATEIETAETTLPIFLRAVAAEIEAGAPTSYSIVFGTGSRCAELHLNSSPDGEASGAALRRWATILGCTTVRVEHNWGGGAHGDKYTAEGDLAGYRLAVWACWSQKPAPVKPATTFLPVAELDRGFDDPPLAGC